MRSFWSVKCSAFILGSGGREPFGRKTLLHCVIYCERRNPLYCYMGANGVMCSTISSFSNSNQSKCFLICCRRVISLFTSLPMTLAWWKHKTQLDSLFIWLRLCVCKKKIKRNYIGCKKSKATHTHTCTLGFYRLESFSS